MGTTSRTDAHRPSAAEFDPAELAELLWSKVQVRGPGVCWLFTAAPSQRQGKLHYKGKQLIPARVAFYVTYGHWPEPMCRHQCDTPRCCNPSDLLEGTAADNSNDMVTRGRSLVQVGSKNHSAKLTESDVAAIREAYATGTQGKLLAINYSVSKATISEIVNYRHWSTR